MLSCHIICIELAAHLTISEFANDARCKLGAKPCCNLFGELRVAVASKDTKVGDGRACLIGDLRVCSRAPVRVIVLAESLR